MVRAARRGNDGPMTHNSEIPEYGSPGAEGSEPTSGKPDAKAAWSDAGERLGGLGAKLKAHYDAQAAEGNAGGTEFKEAAKKLGEAVEAAFHTIGVAAKDKSVQEDVKHVGRSVADALAGTFAGLSGEMKRTFGPKSDAPRPGFPETPPSASTETPPASTDTPPSTAPSNPPSGPDAVPPGSTS